MSTKTFLLAIIFNLCFTQTRAQSLPRTEYGLSLGARNFGLSVAYKPTQNLDLVLGGEFERFGSLGYNVKLRTYPLKSFKRIAFTKATPYLGFGYKSFTSSQFNYSDSREFISSFDLSKHANIVFELGCRYNLDFQNAEQIYRRYRKSVHQDFSFGLTYSKKLAHPMATLISGEDLDKRLSKIKNFLDGGIGFQLICHFSVRKQTMR